MKQLGGYIQATHLMVKIYQKITQAQAKNNLIKIKFYSLDVECLTNY